MSLATESPLKSMYIRARTRSSKQVNSKDLFNSFSFGQGAEGASRRLRSKLEMRKREEKRE